MDDPTSNADDAPLSSAKRLLLEYIADHDAPCPVCRYNLRSLTHDVCPECGQQFRLTVDAVNMRFGALLLFVAPMIMVSGLAILVLYGACIDPHHVPRSAYVLPAAGIVDALAASATYWRRTWFLRQAGRTRILLIGLSWVANITIVGLSIAFFS